MRYDVVARATDQLLDCGCLSDTPNSDALHIHTKTTNRITTSLFWARICTQNFGTTLEQELNTKKNTRTDNNRGTNSTTSRRWAQVLSDTLTQTAHNTAIWAMRLFRS